MVIIPCWHGHSAILLETSTALLKSNKYFVIFFLPESCPYQLELIQNDKEISPNSYQIIYAPKYPGKPTKKPLTEQSQIVTIFQGISNVTKNAYITFPMLHYIFSTLNKESFNQSLYPHFNLNEFNDINYNLKIKYNDLSSLNLLSKIDVVITGLFDVFTPGLCKIFNIPLLIRTDAAFDNHFYGSFMSKSTLPTALSSVSYPFKNYVSKLENILSAFAFYLINIYVAYIDYNPTAKLHGLPTCNVIPGCYKDGALFHPLGIPFSLTIPLKPLVKQFGFLLNEPNIDYAKKEFNEIYEWIDNELENIPIILMSMGSGAFMDANLLIDIYHIFYKISVKQKKCRILWALRQIDDLQEKNVRLLDNNKYFKISEWIPQIQLLHNDKVKLFITHGGSNGIHESLHAAKPMIVWPQTADQSFNAQRVKSLKCGEVLDANRNDITFKQQFEDKINKILFEKTAFYEKNVQSTNDMLRYNGEMHEFVEFVDYVSKYGTKHLVFTDGLDENSLNWYHTTVIDLYLIAIALAFIMYRLFKWCCCCGKRQNKIHPKLKTN